MILLRLLPITCLAALTACTSSGAELGASESRLEAATTVRDSSDAFTVRDGIIYRVARCQSGDCRGVARPGALVFGPVDNPEADQRASDIDMGYTNTRVLTTTSHVYVAGDNNIFRMPLGGGPVEDLGPYNVTFARFAVDGDAFFHFHAWGTATLRRISSTTPWTTLFSGPHVDGVRNDVIDTQAIVPVGNGKFVGIVDYHGPYSLDPAAGQFKFLAPLDWNSATCPVYQPHTLVDAGIHDIASIPGGLIVLCSDRLVKFDPSGASPPKLLAMNPERDRGRTYRMNQGIDVKNGFAYTQSSAGAILKTNLATGTVEVIAPGKPGGASPTWMKSISLDGSYLYFRRHAEIQRIPL